MSEVLMLEDEHRLLKEKLGESLNKKQVIEETINKQFEKLKKLETSLEKIRGSKTATSKRSVMCYHGSKRDREPSQE
jgi:hypothetical protein